MLTDIAQDRKLTVVELRKISDSLLVRDAELAKQYKLIDEVAYFDKVETDIRKQLKLEDDDKITYISLSKYGGAVDLDKDEPKKDDDADDNKIAVIYAEGGISTGSSDEGIGSDDLVSLIRKAREDNKVKAVVLRVNSPGGDALASDLIWREVSLTNESKPVIASMGDVAASGGYYISMGARKIYAQPSTITGSIGVFGMLFNVGPMLKNKAGISFDAVSTGGYTVFPNATRKMTASESAIVQHGVDRIYDVFTTKAAKGRHMDVNALREIAQGRVWSGETAKKIGLVDEMGGLDEAVAAAAKMAKLKKGGYVIKRMPESEDFTMELVKKLTGEDESTEAKVQAIAKVLGPQYSSSLALFMQVQSWQGYQARLPMQVEWN
jgi:protease-4